MNLASTLGISLPLIQAPMAGAQDSRLALAAGGAGALGSLPAAMMDASTLERHLRVLQDAGRPYNVNFFTHVQPAPDAVAEARWREALAPYYAEFGIDPAAIPAGTGRRPFDPEFAEVLEAFRPAAVSFHFGLPPKELLARVQARGAMILSSATTVDEAVWLQAHGADAIIAQGLEAGGHRGHFLSRDVTRQPGMASLVRGIIDAVSVPVIAAGGIADAASVRAAMGLGASAVQIGTSFLLCPEALTNPLHRARLRDAAAPTTLTNLFTGGLARGLHNRVMRELGSVCAAAPPFPMATAGIAPLRAKAEAAGRDDFTPLWSGTNRSGCREAPATEVIAALAEGFAK